MTDLEYEAQRKRLAALETLAARGGTPAEAAVAKTKAAQLRQRLAVEEQERAKRRPKRPRRSGVTGVKIDLAAFERALDKDEAFIKAIFKAGEKRGYTVRIRRR